MRIIGILLYRNSVERRTAEDPILSKVLQRVATGWTPTDKKDPGLRPFALISGTLCSAAGILLHDDRVIVPSALKFGVLDELHVAHPGIRRMKALARQHFYWPGMMVDIERYVKACPRCLKT